MLCSGRITLWLLKILRLLSFWVNRLKDSMYLHIQRE
jgi:hypothetical protein